MGKNVIKLFIIKLMSTNIKKLKKTHHCKINKSIKSINLWMLFLNLRNFVNNDWLLIKLLLDQCFNEFFKQSKRYTNFVK